MTRRGALVCALVCTLVSTALATPARSGAQTMGATIAGTVVSTGTPAEPVRRAIVTLTGGDIPSNLSTVADDAGRFSFQNLTPGRYALTVSKPAYLTTAYGSRRPARPGTAIALAAGQRVEVNVPLPRGAVITGTVRDANGRPIGGVPISVSPAAAIGGTGRLLLSQESLLTDDRGMYRAFGLMPGEYVVSAVPRVVSGGEMQQMTAANVNARLRALEQRHGTTSVLAVGAVAPAAAANVASASGAEAPIGFAPIYYPGTPMASGAARLAVAAGDERAGIDIVLAPVRAARVSGTLQSGSIPPTRIRPTLTVIGPAQPSAFLPTRIGPAADGSFSFRAVTPGRYTLSAQTGPGAMMALADGRGGSTNNPDVPATFATVDVSVDGLDIEGIVLTLRPALSLAGRVAFDATVLTPPELPAGLRVLLADSSPAAEQNTLASSLLGGSLPSANVAADGTFVLPGIVPGSYTVTARAPPADGAGMWWLRSVMVGGRDVLDVPLEIDGSSMDMTGAVVTFSDRRAELHGTLSTASGQPATEFTVIVYPSERAFWRPGARRIRTARPASDGAFILTGLPGGEYLIAALTDAEPEDWQQPSFLEQIVASSIKVTIADGQRVRQDLKIAR